MLFLRKHPFFLLLAISVVAITTTTACKKDKSNGNVVPYVAVDYPLALSSPEAYRLNSVGGYIYVPAGYRGIVLYRQTIDTYIAADRACPNNPQDDCERVAVDSSGVYIKCPCCGSRFSMDGNLLQGPSTQALRKYQVLISGDLLRITN